MFPHAENYRCCPFFLYQRCAVAEDLAEGGQPVGYAVGTLLFDGHRINCYGVFIGPIVARQIATFHGAAGIAEVDLVLSANANVEDVFVIAVNEGDDHIARRRLDGNTGMVCTLGDDPTQTGEFALQRLHQFGQFALQLIILYVDAYLYGIDLGVREAVARDFLA